MLQSELSLLNIFYLILKLVFMKEWTSFNIKFSVGTFFHRFK